MSEPVESANASGPHTEAVAIASASSSIYSNYEGQVSGSSFGHCIRDAHFLMAPGFVNLNHGSFGCVPKLVANEQQRLFFEQESHPDRWFRKSFYEYIDASREIVARFVNASAEGLVLVESASTAFNSIVRSMAFQRGDKVLVLSTAYAMVVETLEWLQSMHGIEIVKAEVEFPMKDKSQIISSVSKAFEAHKDIKLAIFSHISSMPSLIEPIEDFIRIIRDVSPGTLVMIDGAHAPGHIEINVESLGADFYFGNCHKWMYAPKGTAFMWVAPSQRKASFPEPTVISSTGYRDFLGRFSYTGTRDYTALAALPAAIRFRSEVLGGSDNISGYCRSLAKEAAELLVNMWSTSLLVPIEMSGLMINVIVPSNDKAILTSVQKDLDEKYGIYGVFGFVKNSASNSEEMVYFTRISIQVYLELVDIENFGKLVLKLLHDYCSSSSSI